MTRGPEPIATERLVLHPLGVAAARAVLAGRPATEEAWAPGYPFADEVGVLRLLVASGDDPQGWGPWQICRAGTAIGGIGLLGVPDGAGAVEVGYGLVPRSRGAGLAAEALRSLAGWALDHGARQVYGDTTPDNEASWRTMLNAGFHPVDVPAIASGPLRRFALDG